MAIRQPLLKDPAAEAVSGLQYCDAEAIPEQHIGAPKSGEASTNYSDMRSSTRVEGLKLQHMLVNATFHEPAQIGTMAYHPLMHCRSVPNWIVLVNPNGIEGLLLRWVLNTFKTLSMILSLLGEAQ
jgi:hypothetical protein